MSLKDILKHTITPESKTAIRDAVVEYVLNRLRSSDLIQGMHEEEQNPTPRTKRRENDDPAYRPHENRSRTFLPPSDRVVTRSKSRGVSYQIKRELRTIITDIVDRRFPDDSGNTSARNLMHHLNESEIINGELCYLCKCPIINKYHADHKIPSTMSFLCGFDQIQLNRHSSRYRHITTFNSYDRDDQNLNLHETTMAPTHPICNILKTNDNFIGFKIESSNQIIASVNVDTIHEFVDNLMQIANSLTIKEGPTLRDGRTVTSYFITNKINEERIKYLRSILSEDDATTLECIQIKNKTELKRQLTRHFQIIANKFNNTGYTSYMMHSKLDEIKNTVVERYNARNENRRNNSRSRSRDRNANGFKKTKTFRLNKTRNKRINKRT